MKGFCSRSSKIQLIWKGEKQALRYHTDLTETVSKTSPHKGAVSPLAGYHVLTMSPGRGRGPKGTGEAASPHPHPRVARRAPPSSPFGSPRRLRGPGVGEGNLGSRAHSPCGRAPLGRSPVPHWRNAAGSREGAEAGGCRGVTEPAPLAPLLKRGPQEDSLAPLSSLTFSHSTQQVTGATAKPHERRTQTFSCE